MNFVIIDLSLLALFALFATFFLYTRRKNLKKEGALLLYKTQWGVKLIDYIGTKYKGTLKFLSYVSITLGYFLMAGILFLIGQSVYLYLTTNIASVIKAPPIAPLIPYFPKLFGLQSFFPNFYFAYFIIAIVIVATVHEISHGIFAKRYGIRIKSTGFAFLKYFPAFFGAFVEQDDNQMEKSKKFEQMSVLSAGVFANVLIAILFYFILFGFFSVTFIPMGVQFNDYAYSAVEVDKILSVNGVAVSSYEDILNLANETELSRIMVGEKGYIGTEKMISSQKGNEGIIFLYENAPAINAQIGNVINEIGGVKIKEIGDLQNELMSYSLGDTVEIRTIEEGKFVDYEIVLKENPEEKNSPWLGIGFYGSSQSKISQIVSSVFPQYKKPSVYYQPRNDLSIFVKDLLWWVFIINLLVALFNMLPLGILDGGRFFEITVLSLTGSKKFAKRFFNGISILILLLFLILVAKWLFSFI